MAAYGKIFVVIAVLSIILVGIFVYLFVIDRKLNKLKKEVEEKMSHQRK
jgi:CcmD family protein